MLEIAVVVAIAAMLVLLLLPLYRSFRDGVLEARCRQNLADIRVAIGRYRADHRNQAPPHLTALVPGYLTPDQVTCPVTVERARALVLERRNAMQAHGGSTWASCFWPNRRGLDDPARRGEFATGFTQLLRVRRGSTPRAICFDHREPYSLLTSGWSPTWKAPGWMQPLAPVLVLRESARVERSSYGAPWMSGVGLGTEAYLRNL